MILVTFNETLLFLIQIILSPHDMCGGTSVYICHKIMSIGLRQFTLKPLHIQSNFSGSNVFGTLKTSSKQG